MTCRATWQEEIGEWASTFPKFIDELEQLLTTNRIWKQRTVDIGIMTPEDALAWGFTGPCLRASGVPWDLRKSQPYDNYDRGRRSTCQWPATVTATTAISSAWPRCGRAPTSSKQCLEKMQPGDVKIQDRKFTAPRREEMKKSMEALIHHFKLYTEGYHIPAGSTYTATESPPRASSASISLRTVPTGPIVARYVRLAIANLQAVEHMSKRHMLADAVAIIGSVDVVFGEIDR